MPLLAAACDLFVEDGLPLVHQTPALLAPQTLSAQLRDQTSDAHIAVEAALDIDVRLASIDAYTSLLVVLRGFYRPLEDALCSVTGWDLLNPPIDVGSLRRAALIDVDLGRLGVRVPTDAPVLSGGSPAPSDLPALGSLACAIGCLYVLEGSALGGRIISRRARATLGEEVPVAFFSGAHRPSPGGEWRTLQAAINAFGVTQTAAVRNTTVSAARQTFAALGGRFDRGSPR